MNPKLTLKKDKQGDPQRLLLFTDKGEANIVSEATFGIARKNYSPDGRDVWSLPVDPAVLRQVRKVMHDTVACPDLLNYLIEMMKKQERVDEATRDHTIDHPNLWDFQKPSVRFLETARAGILAHQMGMGKTVVVCAALKHMGFKRTLIVCPNGWSWASHLHQWIDNPYDVSIVQAGSSKKGKLGWDEGIQSHIFSGTKEAREKFIAELLKQDRFVLITNFEQMTIHQETLSKGTYDLCVVDEAHRLKNHQAKRSRASRKIIPRADYRWLLTGTPIRRGYEDLWALLNLCDPVRFTSYWNFVKIYFRAHPNHWGGMDIQGPRDSYAFNRMLSSYMFRKTKKEVMPQLPDKLVEDIKLPMTEKQEALYRQMEKDFRVLVKKEMADGKTAEELVFAPNVAAQLMRLRQLCLDPSLLDDDSPSAKLYYLAEFLEDFQETDEKLLIFAYFRGFIDAVRVLLQSMKIPHQIFVGGMGAQRGREIESLLNENKTKVVVGTIGAMGEFLNLQAASQVIFCDRSWSQKENEQAEDRVHRGEIKTSPVIKYLVHPRSVDLDIMATCRRKQRMEDETVNRVEVLRNLLRRG